MSYHILETTCRNVWTFSGMTPWGVIFWVPVAHPASALPNQTYFLITPLNIQSLFSKPLGTVALSFYCFPLLHAFNDYTNAELETSHDKWNCLYTKTVTFCMPIGCIILWCCTSVCVCLTIDPSVRRRTPISVQYQGLQLSILNLIHRFPIGASGCLLILRWWPRLFKVTGHRGQFAFQRITQ